MKIEKLWVKEYNKNITYELIQYLKIMLHACLIGSSITFLVGGLLYII